MFLTNLDTVTITFFLASGIVLITLFGILIPFNLKYKESRTLLQFFLRLVLISFVVLTAYGFIVFFRWPSIVDILVFAFLNIINVFSYLRLFSIFRQFVNFWSIFLAISLIVLNFIIFMFQSLFDINLLILAAGFLSLLTVVNLHFLALSVLIEFQKEVKA